MKAWYNWNSANIAVWNKTRFPNNTGDKQRAKLAGEMMEYFEATDKAHKLEEKADVYIAAAGLIRFGGNDAIIGNFICYKLEQEDTDGRLKYAISQKMIENIKREFDENMQHIGS